MVESMEEFKYKTKNTSVTSVKCFKVGDIHFMNKKVNLD